MKRNRFLLSSLMVLMLALTAVGVPGMTHAQGTPTVNTDLSGTVTYWTTFNTVTPEFKALTDEVIPAFNKLYPNVKIDAQAIPDTDLRQKMLTAIAGGQTPDLARMDIVQVPEFADLGALEKVDDLIPNFDTYKGQFYPGPLATNFYKGNYYGLPLDTNTRVLFYNKDVFQKAGITDAPTTFDEFTAACEKVKALGGDMACFAEGGTGAWNILPWIWSNGGAVTNDDYTKATGYLNGEATVGAITLLNDMLKNGTLSDSILGGGIATSDAIGKDQAGMIVDGPWMPPIFQAQYPDLNYGLSAFPAGTGGSVSVVGGEDIVLFKNSKNKDAALAFMQFTATEQAQIAMGKTGQMPVLKSLSGNSALPEYFAVFQKQLETAMPRTPSPAWPKIDEAVSTAVQQVLRGEKDPQAAMDEAAATVDQLLAKYK